MSSLTYQPVIIIGAPRSGTNMLRDVLTRLPGFATWACDEINPVWKHGSITVPSDELAPERARAGVRSFMQRRFGQVARRSGADYVVEKTCANSLRVLYVDRLVPDARYLALLRDGRDAVASTMRRWQRPVAGGVYYLKKLRYTALSDLPWVVGSALTRRLRGLANRGGGAWSSWGPEFAELHEAVREGRPLAELCALQWARCVERSLTDLGTLEPGRRLVVSYERFVEEPLHELQRVLSFLDVAVPQAAAREAVATVSAGSVGKWRQDLGPDDLARIEPIIAGAMRQAAEASRRGAS